MIFKTNKNTIHAMYCDFSSSWHPTKRFFDEQGYNWPDDFDRKENIGQARLQLIEDFKGGLSFYNYDGNLYPFGEKKIIERRSKVKESVITERFGNRNPFLEDNVYLAETGFNQGEIQYMAFNYEKEGSSFTSFRKLLYTFPLSVLTQIVLSLKEQHNKGASLLNELAQLETKKILECRDLKRWQFMERATSPSQDEYNELFEIPLHHYHFQQNAGLDVWIKFDFFQG